MASEPATGPITGLGGSVSIDGTTLDDIRNWRLNRGADVKLYSSSSTSGWEKNAKGVRRWSVTFEIFLNQGELALGFDEGDLVDFIGTTKTGKTCTGEARIESIEAGVDIEGAEFEGATVTAIGNGSHALA